VQIQSTMGSDTPPHAFRGSARESSSTQGHRGRRRWGLAESRATGLRSDVRLTLPSRPENVAVIRHVLGAFAEALRLPPDLVEDMRLAVTEACTNVVVHAYANGDEGPMAVTAGLRDGALTVVVSDEGRGILPRPDSPGLGLGLPLIATLASSLELGTNDRKETEVRMTFELDRVPEGERP